MIEQFWFGGTSLKLFGVLRYPSSAYHPLGAIFCTGFGQNKSGFHFTFTRMAHQLSSIMPTLQFDYRGWGDSEGETTVCTLSTLLEDTQMAMDVLRERTGCRRYMLIGAGFGNWIAASAGCCSPDNALVLLAPYLSPLPLRQAVGEAYAALLTDQRAIIDTAQLGHWESGSVLSQCFLALGASRSYAKGISVRWQLLTDLAGIDSMALLHAYPGPALEFYQAHGRPLAAISHQQTLELPEGVPHLSHPKNHDFMIDALFSWASHLLSK